MSEEASKDNKIAEASEAETAREKIEAQGNTESIETQDNVDNAMPQNETESVGQEENSAPDKADAENPDIDKTDADHEDTDNVIALSGSLKWATQDDKSAYRVIEGSVCVYILYISGGKPGRRILLTQCDTGEEIPSLCALDNVYKSGWMFYFAAPKSGEAAKLEKFDPETRLDEIRTAFLVKCFGNGDGDFNTRFVGKYNEAIESEKRVIGGIGKDRASANIAKSRLIQSVFTKKTFRHYDYDTDSPVYNLASIYCDYLNLQMCPYRSLHDVYGDNFTINDIARASHFVARTVTLDDNWYKKRGYAFIGKYKDSGKPVLCIQMGARGYFAYDTEHDYDIHVNGEVASLIEEEAVVFYQKLPSGPLKLKDVIRFGFRRVETRDITNFFVMYLLVTLIGLLLPVLNKQMFDTLIPLGKAEAIYEVGLVILSFMIGNIFFSMVQNLASFRAVKNMEYNIVAATYGRIFRLPQQFIDDMSSTELVNRASTISTVFTQTVSSGVSAATGALLSLFYLWRMFTESKVLAWRGLFMAIFSGLVMYFFGRIRVAREKEKLEHSTKANGRLYHYITGILKIKVSGIETRSAYEYEKENVESARSNVKSTNISNVGTVFSTIMSMVYTGVIYYTVVKKKQSLTIGEYAAFNSAYGMFTSAINQLVGFFLTNATLVPVMDRIKPIFEQEAEIPDQSIFPGKLEGNIEVAHLDFTYEDESEPVLKDICMSIKAGEFVGIVGPSGSGKSTLLKCLLGFENPTKGNIFYDNKDITTMDKCGLRRQMGVVLQDGALVVGNILTNVTMSAPNMDASDAMELLKEVGLYDDVEEMPMGIFTSISEGGGTVSGGQKQRILLARAIANNPSILYLDEATSALDNITQQKVCENLKNRNITRVMIAHRLSTVVGCDRIYVIDRGKVVEHGSFDELMDKKGLFYELAKRQQVG